MSQQRNGREGRLSRKETESGTRGDDGSGSQIKIKYQNQITICFASISRFSLNFILSLLFVSGQNNSFASLHSPRLMMIDMNTRESNEISRTDKKERNENREQGIQAEEQPSEESYTAREKILLSHTLSLTIYTLSSGRKGHRIYMDDYLFSFSCLSS